MFSQHPGQTPDGPLTSPMAFGGVPVVNENKPRVFYRNLFHTMHGKFLHDALGWEGSRVYIHDSVGYSGNAKRFKRRPEKGK